MASVTYRTETELPGGGATFVRRWPDGRIDVWYRDDATPAEIVAEMSLIAPAVLDCCFIERRHPLAV